MYTEVEASFKELIKKLETPESLNLDELRGSLVLLSARWGELHDRTTLYESELQRELRAKIDLCGGVTCCPDVDDISILNGEELLSARRAASLQFNRVFYMAPLTRNLPNATTKNRGREKYRTLENEVRQRVQKNL